CGTAGDLRASLWVFAIRPFECGGVLTHDREWLVSNWIVSLRDLPGDETPRRFHDASLQSGKDISRSYPSARRETRVPVERYRREARNALDRVRRSHAPVQRRDHGSSLPH